MGHGYQNALYAEPLTYAGSAIAHLGAAFRFVAMLCDTNGENCSKSLKDDLFFFQNSLVFRSSQVHGLIRGAVMR